MRKPLRVRNAPIGAQSDQSAMRVFLTMPRYFVARATDQHYVYHNFARLRDKWDIEFLENRAPLFLLRYNLEYIRQRALRICGVPYEDRGQFDKLRVPESAELTYSSGLFPDDPTTRVPVIWENAFAPISLEVDRDQLRARLRASARKNVESAALIVTGTTASAQFFLDAFPSAEAKLRVIPYYLPEVEPISLRDLQNKSSNLDKIRLLFVGKEARRKGLDVFVEAWSRTPARVRQSFSVRVVSAMLDGMVKLPEDWSVSKFVPDISREMENAHVLVFPTKMESFGLVLVEAMARGCLALTSASPIQRSIVGEQAGVFVDPRSCDAIIEGLTALAREPMALPIAMAAARERFVSLFHHMPVGRQYADAFAAATGRRLSPITVDGNGMGQV